MSHYRNDNPYNQNAFADNSGIYKRWDSPVTWTMGPGGYSGTIEDTDPNNNLEDLFYSIGNVPEWANTKDWSSMWPASGTSPEGYNGHSHSEASIQNIIQLDIATAFDLWSEVADISFVYQAWDPNNIPDIVIWCGEPEVGGESTTQHAYSGGYIVEGSTSTQWPYHGDIHVHNNYRWYSNTLGLSTPTASTEYTMSLSNSSMILNFTTVISHEIGHSLGLGHVNGPVEDYYGENYSNQTMYTWVAGNPITQSSEIKKLGWGDIDGIQAIFGANPSYTEPSITVSNDTYTLDLSSSNEISDNIISNDIITEASPHPVNIINMYPGDISESLLEQNGISTGAMSGIYGILTILADGDFTYNITSSSISSNVTDVFTYMIGTTLTDNVLPLASYGLLTINIYPDTGGPPPPPPTSGVGLSIINTVLGNRDTSSEVRLSDYTLGSENLPLVAKNTNIITYANSKKISGFDDGSGNFSTGLTSLEVINIQQSITSVPIPLPASATNNNFTVQLDFNHNIEFNSGALPYYNISITKNGSTVSGSLVNKSLTSPINSSYWSETFSYQSNLGDEDEGNIYITVKIDDFAEVGSTLILNNYLVEYYACRYTYDITYNEVEWGYFDTDGMHFGVWFNLAYHYYNSSANYYLCGYNAGPDYQSNYPNVYFVYPTNPTTGFDSYKWCHGFNSRGTSNNPLLWKSGVGWGLTFSTGTTDQQKCWDPNDPVAISFCATNNCSHCKVNCEAWSQLDTSVPLNEQEGGPTWPGTGGPCVKGVDAYYAYPVRGSLPLGTYQCEPSTCRHTNFGVESTAVWEYGQSIAPSSTIPYSAPPCLDDSFSSLQLATSSTPQSLINWIDSAQVMYKAEAAANNYVGQYLDVNLTTLFNNNTCARSFYDAAQTTYSNNCIMKEFNGYGVIRVNNIILAHPANTATFDNNCIVPNDGTLSYKLTPITINTLLNGNASNPGIQTLRNIPSYNTGLNSLNTNIFTNKMDNYMINHYADLLPSIMSNMDLNSYTRGTNYNKYVQTNSVYISQGSSLYSNNSNCQ
jgi:hypothetical protein